MIAHLALALLHASSAFQQQTQADTRRSQRDSTRAVRDSIRRNRPKKEPKRLAVTPELFANAFKDSAARSLLALAREARTRQDSALQSYDATTYQRISAGLGFTRFGRDRLAFRNEQATKVQWRRGVGAYVDVTGSRAVIPISGKSGNIRMDGDISPVPYFPGSETLWIGSSTVKDQVDENEGIINPVAGGSEAYYTYAVGDSATFRLPDGKAIRLRELQVRPRSPQWNLAVGSLWFDLSGGQLVRAAYRMSVPMDIKAIAEADDSTSFKDVPALVKPMLFPMTASISAIGVEYGLYQGRFWLPRVQVLEGGANMSFMRVPFKLEQKFEYENVNSGGALAPIPTDTTNRRNGANVSVEVGGPSRADSINNARRTRTRKAQCARNVSASDSSGSYTYTRNRPGNPNPVLVRVPCDSTRLANSPDLPRSIYDNGDETFSSPEMDDLVKQALGMGAQARFAPTLPHASLENFRYNRVEGLSVGARVDQELGAGYSAHASARLGIADLEPNVELSGARSDLTRTVTLSAYNHLVSASDWGNPLSLGASISSFLFGRDEGFYYRASGLELGSSPDASGGNVLLWSVFAEQERSASPHTTFSLAHAIHGSDFEPNFVSTRGVYVGGRTRYIGSYGLDPEAFRLLTDLRIEAAHGDTGNYGRAAIDLTASHAIGDGAFALTLAGGSSLGSLPNQRNWFLGGVQTVRGQRPGREIGNAFWLARFETALNSSITKPVIFTDFGWAGNRNNFTKVGIPMSGVGVGASVMDGLLRFDVARGINPERMWRVDAYIEARF